MMVLQELSRSSENVQIEQHDEPNGERLPAASIVMVSHPKGSSTEDRCRQHRSLPTVWLRLKSRWHINDISEHSVENPAPAQQVPQSTSLEQLWSRPFYPAGSFSWRWQSKTSDRGTLNSQLSLHRTPPSTSAGVSSGYVHDSSS